jgi:hypothetical protein
MVLTDAMQSELDSLMETGMNKDEALRNVFTKLLLKIAISRHFAKRQATILDDKTLRMTPEECRETISKEIKKRIKKGE